MTKYHRNAVGSVALDRPAGGNFRLWPAFSTATFRRRIIDTMRCGVSRHRRDEEPEVANSPEKQPKKPDSRRNAAGSERLSELLSSEARESATDESEAEMRRKMEAFEGMQSVVKRLQGGGEEREAAMDVRRLAKEDSEARVTLAMLGAIPPLVGMLDSDDPEFQIAALYALLNLGIGNDMNKAAIVKAGALHKMLKLIDSPSKSPSVSEAIVANFLGLSALDSNKPIIGASGAVRFLSGVLRSSNSTSSSQSKQDSLRALFNLSISPSNIPYMLESDLVPFFLNALGDMDISERILSILSNIVSTSEGRRSVSNSPDAYQILIDVLNWTDSPGCQEKAAYVLMVMAHKVFGDRQAMIEAGVVSSLLELTLLGSTLAQKRASRILECLRVDKGKQVSEGYGGSGAPVSAPICGASSSSAAVAAAMKRGLLKDGEAEEEEMMMSEERRAVKQLVQQSLQNNMKRIVKRANLPQDFAPSDHFKSLTASSTSKSLPL
ncbi:U-box domain-containing protein 12-like [Magnolia sinica]|uniref:U-box domain-containing protein 12-like n=1 Tax=Magnolia sinica TaxID=86752 RepID=UPI00265887AD|nr:U-box domain-containing protein 12-like [Magnolia sinica]XP_058067609.1 U-box domain-containing protein 12-like [Magnolia sinica]XP_058067610.1 U-box domain-containing protein 12-like [Magnolia sinica]